MTKATDFSQHLHDFFFKYLNDERGASKNTIETYEYTFVLLIRFFEEVKQISRRTLNLKKITKQHILEFLDWLQKTKHNGNSTRNLRLAGIHSFYDYLSKESPKHLHCCLSILGIRFKKVTKTIPNYLSVEEVKSLLLQPDRTTWRGRRDLTLLSLMYGTGARVQEIIDLTPSSFKLDGPQPVVRILGKGDKLREVPLMNIQAEHLRPYLKENKLDRPEANQHPLFFNTRKQKLTRAGVGLVLKKYMKKAMGDDKSKNPGPISCHSLRHSRAMHWIEAGMDLMEIRDLLGHANLITTEWYAKLEQSQKRAALEKTYTNVNPGEQPKWNSNDDIFGWFKKL